MIIFFAHLMLNRQSFKRGRVLFYSLFLIFPVFLVFIQPDLGSSLVVGFFWLAMVFASGISTKEILIFFGSLSFVTPLVWQFLKPYQKERLASFINPFSDPLGAGYNLIQSMIAVGSGRFLGRFYRLFDTGVKPIFEAFLTILPILYQL